MSLLAILGLKDPHRPAPAIDLVPIIKHAVHEVKALPDTRARAEAVARLRRIDVEWREALSLPAADRDAKLGDLRARLQALVAQVASTARRDEAPPEPRSPQPEAAQPSASQAPSPVDEEEARRKRRERALKDIEVAKARWAAEDPLIVDYFKKDFADVTLTEGMENVSEVSGWVGTGAKMVPGGQGVAAAMQVVGLTADVASTTYVVLKALLVDPAAVGGGRLAQKGAEKIGVLALKKAKKTIVRKLTAKYPLAPEPLLEKLVDEAVDRLVGQAAEALGRRVEEVLAPLDAQSH